MSIKHHISDPLLMSYAAGGLSEAWSLVVATHAALCPHCRDGIAGAEAIGGAMIEDIEPEPMAGDAFNTLMARLDAGEPMSPLAKSHARAEHIDTSLPEPLSSYIIANGSQRSMDLPWQRLGLGVYQIPITLGDTSATARLLRIPAGRPVPEHGHAGLELTLVLSGAFTDGEHYFAAGDLEEADESLIHQPRAVEGEDCICLAVTDAPLRFSSPIVRLMQPLLKI